jgi:hypothetical protein
MSPLSDHLTDCRELVKARTLTRTMLPRAIRDAYRAGATSGQLALATGLTRQRIHQIVKEER